MFGVVELLQYDVIVPFVCYQCGNCCNEFTPQIIANVIPDISKYLKIPEEDLRNQHEKSYLSQDTDSPDNCLFLSNQNKCKIYPFRPDNCRLFPFTDFGSEGTNCQGHKEYMSVVTELFKGRKYAAMWEPDNYPKSKLREMPDKEFSKILQKILNAKLSKLMIKDFIMMNKNPNDFYGS